MTVRGNAARPGQSDRDEAQIRTLCDQVRGAALALHGYLRHGHLERVSHIAQVLGYLRASKIRDAMLINFGAARLQVRKFIV